MYSSAEGKILLPPKECRDSKVASMVGASPDEVWHCNIPLCGLRDGAVKWHSTIIDSFEAFKLRASILAPRMYFGSPENMSFVNFNNAAPPKFDKEHRVNWRNFMWCDFVLRFHVDDLIFSASAKKAGEFISFLKNFSNSEKRRALLTIAIAWLFLVNWLPKCETLWR